MIALTWQTILLLTIAYFLGCIVGCLARKLVGAGAGTSAAAPAFEAAMPASVASPPLREVARVAAVAPAARSMQGAFRRADRDTPDDPAPVEPVEKVEAPPPAPRSSDAPPPATVARPISAEAAAIAAAAAVRAAGTAEEPEEEEAEPDDLTRIRAIDGALAAKLDDLGVRRYADIAAWSSERVHAVSTALNFRGRIERENWIEQAQILARGGATSYATGLASAAIRAMAPPSPPAERGPDVSTRAAFAEPRRVTPVPAPIAVGSRDNLQRIGGISSEIEIGLNAHGVTRYSQIAGWNTEDVGKFDALIGASGRISRENWIEQAQILARGGATTYARLFDERGGPPAPQAITPALAVAPAPAAVPAAPETPPVVASAPPAPAVAPDLSGMRSVRSEAFRTADSMAPSTPAKAEDLKRIRGVGLLIERKLNAMGISSYEQIANWTADDVGTVNAKLEFKGRIERENWIEQARILASGGHTDFSRRFERGEV